MGMGGNGNVESHSLHLYSEGNRRSGVALKYWTYVADTTLPTGWRATKGRQNPQQRSNGWDFFIWRQ